MFGSPKDPPLLLVMGLATQMLAWKESFCEMLAAKGFYVIRYDNRDIGLSKHFDELGPPPLLRRIAFNMLFGRFCKSASPYTLNDMSLDAVHLLDALKIPAAHVCGASMGGMIGQTMAISHPDRVLSLCSIMSTTGSRNLPEGDLAVRLGIMKKPENDSHEARVKDGMRKIRMIAAPGQVGDDLEEYVDKVMKRSYHPVGAMRQINAIMVQADRTEALREIAMPSLIVHGRGDKLVKLACGEATAAAIGGDVRLLIVEGMGHVILSKE
jgi:pimeloyl-ACP methyl ester carboxylesterase